MRYSSPNTVESVVAELARGGAVLAGGTDLVTLRQRGRWDAECMVDIKRIPGLAEFETADSSWIVGGACTMSTVVRMTDSPALGALVDGAGVVGGPQTRRRATVGGNVWRASPSADTVPGLLALDAQVRLVSVSGTRTVALQDFLTGPGMHTGRRDELLEAIVLPANRGASAYRRATHRSSLDLATVGVAVWVARDSDGCSGARVVVGGAAPRALVVDAAAAELVGTALDDAAVTRAAEAVAAAVTPIDDVRGSAEYRRHAARVLVARVARSAWDRAAERSRM